MVILKKKLHTLLAIIEAFYTKGVLNLRTTSSLSLIYRVTHEDIIFLPKQKLRDLGDSK